VRRVTSSVMAATKIEVPKRYCHDPLCGCMSGRPCSYADAPSL
jgi:hypothetical protein